MNQSINQSINQSVSQSSDQPTNESVTQRHHISLTHRLHHPHIRSSCRVAMYHLELLTTNNNCGVTIALFFIITFFHIVSFPSCIISCHIVSYHIIIIIIIIIFVFLFFFFIIIVVSTCIIRTLNCSPRLMPANGQPQYYACIFESRKR